MVLNAKIVKDCEKTVISCIFYIYKQKKASTTIKHISLIYNTIHPTTKNKSILYRHIFVLIKENFL